MRAVCRCCGQQNRGLGIPAAWRRSTWARAIGIDAELLSKLPVHFPSCSAGSLLGALGRDSLRAFVPWSSAVVSLEGAC
jgi:hypothetical protein